MSKRPLVMIAVAYTILIIILRPWLPVPEQKQKTDPPPLVSAVSQKISRIITDTTPQPYDALLGSIIFGGSVMPLDPDFKDRYKRVGLSHLLVASGTQVSILIGVCLALARSLKIPILPAALGTSIINILFTILAGGGASIVRAAIMGQVVLIGLCFDRDADIYTSLAISALLLALWDPLMIFDLGFQLSFAATWSLVYLAPKFETKIPSMIAVSLAPILATIPITVLNFNQLSLAALLVNTVVVPWVEMLTILGFVSTLLGLIFLPLAGILNSFLYLLLIILDQIVYTFAEHQLACINLASPPIWVFGFYYFMLIAIVEKWLDKKKALTVALVFLLCLVWQAALSPVSSIEGLTISVIDVGQGDSILVEAPNGKTMLIDGGPKFKRSDAGKRYVLPFLRKKGINKLDILVLTHPHDDHVGGLPSVIKEIPIGLVIDSGQPHTSKAYLTFLTLIDRKKIPYKLARAGIKVELGTGCQGLVFNPSEPFIEGSALNNNSVAIRLTYGNFAAMLTGDMEKEGEERVLEKYQNIRCQVLKVGHHGSKTSSSAAFFKAVKPETAVISVGAKNKFHHPHPSTVKRMEELGIRIWRTDLNGTVTVRSDGKSYVIETQK